MMGRSVRRSQRDTHAGVFEAHGKDALVDLVELHQLHDVHEEREAVVHGHEDPAVLFALQRQTITVRVAGEIQLDPISTTPTWKE